MGNMVSTVTSAVSALGGAYATDQAASRAARGQREANALNREMWEQSSALSMPWITGGQGAFDALMASYGLGGEAPNFDAFFNSPDYQFALQQGEKSMQARQSAQGNRLSPSALMELNQFGQGMASQQLGNYRSGLQGIAGMGMNALGMLSGAREGYTARGMQGAQNLGDINASRYLGYGNILGNMMGGMGGMNFGGNSSTYGGQNVTGGSSGPFMPWSM